MADYGERKKWRWWEIMELMKQVSRKEIESQTKRYTHTQVHCLHLCDFNLSVGKYMVTNIYLYSWFTRHLSTTFCVLHWVSRNIEEV